MTNKMTRTQEDTWVELCFIFRLWLKEKILAELRHMLTCVCHPVSTFEPVTHYYERWNEFYVNGRHSTIIHYFSTVRNNGISDAWAIEVGVMQTVCLGHKIMCDDNSWKYMQVLLTFRARASYPLGRHLNTSALSHGTSVLPSRTATASAV